MSAIGAMWLWFLYAPEPQPYYLSLRSGMFYERLLLPALPSLPWSKATVEHYHLRGYPCRTGICLSTPESIRAGQKDMDIVQYAPAATIRQELEEQVYHGSVIGAMGVPLLAIPVLFVMLFGGAVVLDSKRRKRILNGLQIVGRWPVSPAGFSGWLGGRKQANIHIPIEASRDDTTTGL